MFLFCTHLLLQSIGREPEVLKCFVQISNAFRSEFFEEKKWKNEPFLITEPLRCFRFEVKCLDPDFNYIYSTFMKFMFINASFYIKYSQGLAAPFKRQYKIAIDNRVCRLMFSSLKQETANFILWYKTTKLLNNFFSN